MSKTLYVTDMDGTLLGPDSKISCDTARIITDLSEHGAIITVATARTPATVEPLLCDTLTSGPAIVMTGASLWNREQKKYMSPAFIEPVTAVAVRDVMESYGLAPFVYILPDDQVLRAFHPAELSAADRVFVDNRSNLELKKFIIGKEPDMTDNNSHCIILFAMGQPQAVFDAAAELENLSVGCSISAYTDPCSGGIGVLEVKAPDTSKANSVRMVADMVGADRIVAFGDNINDLSMMAVADVAVAVGNAVPRVLEAADKVIGTNETDSVARFILSDFTETTTNTCGKYL